MKTLTILATCFCLISCGGGSGGSSSTPTGSTGGTSGGNTTNATYVDPNTTFTGTFIDSPVAGLNYRTETLNGVTDEYGQFEYKIDENITFSLGGIEFPTIKADTYITPLSLFDTEDVTDERVMFVLQLLQSVDSDQNPANGIQLSDAIHQLAGALSVDFTNANYAELLDVSLAAINGVNGSSITIDDARVHFQQSLESLANSEFSVCDKTHEMVGWTGNFQTFSHNVAGLATVIDDCTIEITNFDYDGQGPKVYFYGGVNGDFEVSSAFPMGSAIQGTVFNQDTVRLKLPAGVSLDNFNSISVWCVDFNADFGNLTFTP